MPLVETRGAASAQGFGEFAQAAVAANYIEEVFSTWLYAGTGPSAGQTITNNIDLSTKGGMVWIKNRTDAGTYPVIVDTVRGANKWIYTSATDAQATSTSSVTSFNTNGFTLGTDNGSGDTNSVNYAYSSPTNQVSWTFRKQPKFFDIVTWTGTGAATQTISHNLGSAPGCIIAKSTSAADSWFVYHRASSGTPLQDYLRLNLTNAVGNAGADVWGSTSTTITVDANLNQTTNGVTYVAYLFAHNAGGFGLTGTDNVISCGSFTTDGSGNGSFQNLGYEPQFVIQKVSSSGTGGWYITDNMRGMSKTNTQLLQANTSGAEATEATEFVSLAANGFTPINNLMPANKTCIYIAIRRGPMKVPTVGTSVFGLSARTGAGANATVTGSAGVSDAVIVKNRGSAVASLFSSRLTGTGYLVTSTGNAEVAAGASILQANPWDVMDGVKVGTSSTITNASANTFINYLFDRAPSFMDVVCDKGTGSGHTINHNLAAVPEIMFRKSRTQAWNWQVYIGSATNYLVLNSTPASASDGVRWNNTLATSSVFSVGAQGETNENGDNFVTYLFATCAGVSKVGSYTGTGTTLQIDCGFTAGARFVLIKRTDSNGDWYVWDSARGIIAGDDPYWLTNSNAAEVTNTDYVDTYSAGFEVTSTAPAGLNASGGTYIFLAIA